MPTKEKVAKYVAAANSNPSLSLTVGSSCAEPLTPPCSSYKIKDSLVAAAAKLPEDSSVQTALGQWSLKVAGISWVERQAAKVLFGSPPESSYEEALGYFERSHAIRPSKKAALQAGLAQQKLGKKSEAADWFKLCVDLPGSGEADAELDRQAKAELK